MISKLGSIALGECDRLALKSRVLERFHTIADQRLIMGALVNFHGRHKLLLLALHEVHSRRCGQIVANHAGLAVAEVYTQYGAELGLILDSPLEKNGIINALYHAYGWMAASMPIDERTRLTQALERYRAGELSLAKVCFLLTTQARRCDCRLVLDQYLLELC